MGFIILESVSSETHFWGPLNLEEGLSSDNVSWSVDCRTLRSSWNKLLRVVLRILFDIVPLKILVCGIHFNFFKLTSQFFYYFAVEWYREDWQSPLTLIFLCLLLLAPRMRFAPNLLAGKKHLIVDNALPMKIKKKIYAPLSGIEPEAPGWKPEMLPTTP